MITGKSKGSTLSSSLLRGSYLFVWFTGRYACGRPEMYLIR